MKKMTYSTLAIALFALLNSGCESSTKASEENKKAVEEQSKVLTVKNYRYTEDATIGQIFESKKNCDNATWTEDKQQGFVTVVCDSKNAKTNFLKKEWGNHNSIIKSLDTYVMSIDFRGDVIIEDAYYEFKAAGEPKESGAWQDGGHQNLENMYNKMKEGKK